MNDKPSSDDFDAMDYMLKMGYVQGTDASETIRTVMTDGTSFDGGELESINQFGVILTNCKRVLNNGLTLPVCARVIVTWKQIKFIEEAFKRD